jgi:hypothetical protein
LDELQSHGVLAKPCIEAGRIVLWRLGLVLLVFAKCTASWRERGCG